MTLFLRGNQSSTPIPSKNSAAKRSNAHRKSQSVKQREDIICEQKCHHNVTELDTHRLHLGFGFIHWISYPCPAHTVKKDQMSHHKVCNTTCSRHNSEASKHAIIASTLLAASKIKKNHPIIVPTKDNVNWYSAFSKSQKKRPYCTHKSKL